MSSVTKRIYIACALIFLVITPTFAKSYDGLIILAPNEGQVFDIRHITITALAQVGINLCLSINGVAIDTQKTVSAKEFGIDVSKILKADSPPLFGAWSFVSIELNQGANQIQVTVLDGDYKGTSTQRAVHVIGPPEKIEISASKENLPADGKSQTDLTFTIKDNWGYPVMDGTFVTINLQEGTGEFTVQDADPNTNGIQLRTHNGVVNAALVSGEDLGQTIVVAKCNQVSASKIIKFTTPIQPFLLVGLANGQLGYLKTSGNTGGKYEDGMYHDERLAFYAKGTLFSNYLLTGSYDSDRKFQDRLFRDLDPERLYPLYGDSSSVFYEAQSSGKTYAKLEKDKSYIMWGDYNTELSYNELAAYERSFNGAKLNLEGSPYKLTAIGAKTNRTVTRDEIQGMGISGFYFLAKVPVIQGSEKIRIETRDRYHSEVVLRSEVKYRYNDYDIDYEQGSIFFKQPVPSRDTDYNPIKIVVIYETTSSSQKDLILASHGELKFKNIANSGFGANFGATAVNEDNEIRGYQLRGVDGAIAFHESTELSAEYVESNSFEIKDNAWKIQLNSMPYKDLTLKAYYRDIGNKFDNPSSTMSEIGTLKYGADAIWKIQNSGELKTEYYRSKQPTSQTDITSTSALYKHRIIVVPLTIQTKVEDLIFNSEGNKVNSRSTLASGSLSYQITNRFSTAIQRDQKVFGNTQNYKPNATIINFDYKVTNGIVLNLQHRLEDSDPLRLDATTFGISSQLSNNLSAYGKYQIGGIVEGERNQALIGFRNRWSIGESLGVNAAFERSKTDDKSGAGDYNALSISAEYLPKAPIKGATKYEIRRDFATTMQNAEAGIDLKIYDGLSVIGKHSFYLDQQKASKQNTHIIRNHSILGLAFRPVYTNILNGLAKVDVKQEDNNIIKPSLNSLIVLAP